MITRRERIAYAAGDLGFNFVWQSMELFLLFFYLRGLGLSAGAASLIFLIGSVIDWVADPTVGAVADRMSRTRPMRIWVGIGGPLSGLLLALAFMPLPLDGWPLFAAVLAIHVALRFCYSLGNIPYAALTARISDRPLDHLALTGARMQGAAIGGMIAAGVYFAMPANGSGIADFRSGALLLAVLALPAFLATVIGVRERISTAAAPESRSLMATMAALPVMLRGSAVLRRLLATILVAGCAVTVVNKTLLLLFEEQGSLRAGYLATFLPGLTLLLATPLWAAAARRRGRVAVLVIAGVLNVAAVLALILPFGLPFHLGAITLAITAGNGMSVMFWALVPVVVERSGDQGTGFAARTYALCSIARKLAQAIAPQLIALSLTGTRSVIPAIIVSAIVALIVIVVFRPSGSTPSLREAAR
ncbi:MFS transporter [Sphingomonas sp. BGYR3]|uniref:MFS transporter n=1 Tax=Sphingomonas sp. BGYR3 TaxID=2975483 RepID=UPI0021A414E3|nr:MFS transporter [Sphingomonas sp. BGYR3]MDG5488486.1 MFS transporter [Sphingomonas sp. BGYR3]